MFFRVVEERILNIYKSLKKADIKYYFYWFNSMPVLSSNN